MKTTKVNEVSKVSANSKKDFASLMRNTKAEMHKLGFVSNVITTNCSLGFFEAVAEGAGIKLSDRTKERLVNITKSKDTVKKAIVGYFPRTKDSNGNLTLVVAKTYRVDDEFVPSNNTRNPKVLDDAVMVSDVVSVLQKGYTEKPYKFFKMPYGNDEIIVLKTVKSSNDGNIITTEKVFHKKERFSIDEAAVSVIAYAQSDVELILD